ncbi:MAG: methionyl-tRNA formyltransferase [Candidatus Binatus sp.]|uniref:methionyl-tRNA formyltransferase n=1 Tax=Candidatus Binatus sp. TaxID=2811406 RepID=UPI002725B7B2|nr:methionyl-tRNA formyltransferase [Candidatus Binatus sp.]MDO8433573.1 methionyl-tRNA formyltransferase [Candidatus Binatus sp.]
MVFMGTPSLAAHILERMIAASRPPSDDAASNARFHVVGVITRPDQPRGRRLQMEPSEVGAVAARHAIPTLKPVKIRTPEFLAELIAFEPDLLVVAAYGRILPQSILDVPKIAPINVHASLLPKYRGAAPIEAAILAGEHETGVTIMRIIEQMDAGPTYLHRRIPIAPDDTQGTLKEKLAELGADAILEAIALLIRGELKETPQDEAAATYTSQIEKADAAIDWSKPASAIERMTRAYDPWPVARTTLGGEEILIWRAAVENERSSSEVPGTIVNLKPSPIVQCGVGRLRLIEVQAPGRKRMPAADFFRGKRIGVGARLGA